MTMKLSTTLRHVNTIPQSVNTEILKEFHEYLKEIETSENDQNQNLKQITVFARFLGEKTFYNIKMREEIVAFLNTKVKDIKLDPDKKWITTWNDYLWRIKYFFRWFHNYRLVKEKKDPGLASLYVAMYLYSLFQ
jgi:integrase/recombinase XerD